MKYKNFNFIGFMLIIGISLAFIACQEAPKTKPVVSSHKIENTRVEPGSVLESIAKDDKRIDSGVNEAHVSAINASEQAGISYKQAREAYDAGNFPLAAILFEKGISAISGSGDPGLMVSMLARELYLGALLSNEMIGMTVLNKGIVSEEIAIYFKKIETLALQLEDSAKAKLKKDINDSLPPQKKLNDFLANSYYNLGMIYNVLKKDEVAKGYVQKLRTLGYEAWAQQVEGGIPNKTQ